MSARRCFRLLQYRFYRMGIRYALPRRILAAQTCLAMLCALGGLLARTTDLWIFWCGIGAMLAVCYFFNLTKAVPHFMLNGYTSSTGILLFLRSQLRLFCIVCVGGVCVLWLHAPVLALLAGFSTIFIVIVWNVFLYRKVRLFKKSVPDSEAS